MNKNTTRSEEQSDPKDRAKVAIKGHLIQTFILQKAKLASENQIPAEWRGQNQRASRYCTPRPGHSSGVSTVSAPPRPGSRH